jgi:hypothetical protein
MSNNNIDAESNKKYSYGTPDISKAWYCEEQARSCNQCREPTVVAFNLRTHQVETFDLNDNYPARKIKHRHPADNITKASVISAIAVEKRYLFERRPGDYDPFSGRIIN